MAVDGVEIDAGEVEVGPVMVEPVTAGAVAGADRAITANWVPVTTVT